MEVVGNGDELIFVDHVLPEWSPFPNTPSQSQKNTIASEVLKAAHTSELTLKELMTLGGLDARRFRLCKSHGITTFAQLLEHYLEFGSFLGWRNCGQLSNLMLISTCKEYSKVDSNILRLERKAMEFSDREVAFSALESGFVDAVIFTKPSGDSITGGRVLIEGRVAICKASEV